ncbi:DinB family protein [Rhizobium leucaenae]|uniref:Putative damage-inducible protein DinB n=1 Tax=Rhizobium leucaenae TaxID=29450 RepID=A0A7W6ZPM6_9HYPH|nr:DinB family protein [Rhizobium leucaenae]MBB4566381.1 putative damage-inducible protein DinB [Rhizobium leucaenae]MBB6304516.1 putative damage-inducible protein DinB [Rhizobium leucaenae]
MSGFDPIRVFRKLAYNNALANTRLHQACSALQPGEFEAKRVSFFPSIKSTLNHILTVDWFYVDALEGGTLGLKAFDNEEPFDTLDALSMEQGKVDRRLANLCEHLNPEALVRLVDLHRDNRIQRERAEDVLSHLFQHQTHHRGQVHAMLAGSSVAPPQLDEFIVADDARFRGEELAVLSWDETMLMR